MRTPVFDLFDIAWAVLADVEAVPVLGSDEYTRIRREWQGVSDQHQPRLPQAFIIVRYGGGDWQPSLEAAYQQAAGRDGDGGIGRMINDLMDIAHNKWSMTQRVFKEGPE